MSDPELEEQKKAVLPFMQRAQEMEKVDPKIAYYCRMYAVEQAFKFEKRAKEITSLVSAALAQMEKDKPKLGLDRENDRYACEGLALKVFNNADKVDRAGRADLTTAKTFLAASYFLEILNQFGPVDGDLLEKQRYAAWRAAEIRKAVREGRPPLPPNATEQQPSLEDLPPAYGGSSGSGAESFSAAGAAPAAPPAQEHPWPASAPGAAPWSDLPSAPAPAHPVPMGSAASPMYPPAGPAPIRPGQRFRPGSKVLLLPEGRQQPEHGTVGQVLQGGPNGECRYRVALKDRLEDAFEQQLAPNLAEGDAVMYLGPRGPMPALAVLMNDMAWPPTYLVCLPDGSEQAAAAGQLSLLLPEGAPSMTSSSGSLPRPDAQGSGAFPVPVPQFRPASAQQPAMQPPPPQHALPAGQASQTHFPQVPASSQPPAAPASLPQLPPGHKPSVQAIMEAQKSAKYAVSSLNFEDVPAAVKYLQAALRVLTTPSSR